MNYNSEYACRYKSDDIFCETDTVNDFEKAFIETTIYKNDVMNIFNISNCDDGITDNIVKELHNMLKDVPSMVEIIAMAAATITNNSSVDSALGSTSNSDTELGIIVLMSYDYLYLFHPCVCDIISNATCIDININCLKTELSRDLVGR